MTKFNPWKPALEIEAIFLFALLALAVGRPEGNWTFITRNVWTLVIPFVFVVVYKIAEFVAAGLSLFILPTNTELPAANRRVPYNVGGKLRTMFNLDSK